MPLFRLNLLVPALLVGLSMRLASPVQAASPVSDASVLTRSLPNGMRVILKEDHSLPLVAMDLWIKTGSAACILRRSPTVWRSCAST